MNFLATLGWWWTGIMMVGFVIFYPLAALAFAATYLGLLWLLDRKRD